MWAAGVSVTPSNLPGAAPKNAIAIISDVKLAWAHILLAQTLVDLPNSDAHGSAHAHSHSFSSALQPKQKGTTKKSSAALMVLIWY